MSTTRFVLTPRGDFSLSEAIRFLHGFAPLSCRGDDEVPGGEVLRLAFCADARLAPGARSRAPEQRGPRRGDGRTAPPIRDGDPTAGRADAVARHRRVGAAGRDRR